MPATDLDLLETAALEAGEIAQSYWRADPEVWDKGGDDPVSEADLAVDQHLKQRLLAARPDYGWVSEETADDSARLAADRVFIVDPIDGTRAYVAGERTWAHSIAVAERGVVTAGAVFLPIRQKMYLAALGQGATLNGQEITVSDRTQVTGSNILSPRVTYQSRFWHEIPDVERAFRPSLAYRLALVGEGRFDGMIALRNAWEWDIAAGSLIAAEAGAMVSDRTGARLKFNSPARQTAGILTTAPDLHGQLLAALDPSGFP